MASPVSFDDALERITSVTEEFKSSTDRATAIVAGAFLDDILGSVLQAFMLIDPGSDTALFANNGPLSTFSAKITLAYRLGIISEGERSDLETVRKIRNRFAHEVNLNSFSDQSTRDLCRNLETPIQMLSLDKEANLITSAEGLLAAKAPMDNPKAIFQEAIVHIMVKLGGRLATAMQSRRTVAAEFTDAHEPDEALLKLAQRQHSQLSMLKGHLVELGHPPHEAEIDVQTFTRVTGAVAWRIASLKAAHSRLAEETLGQ